jgi:NAD(P)-dependent dehydrogenase (short-subunit alcohol dehydrogenase family)
MRQIYSFKEKRVLIIGGSGGIGMSSAISFAKLGADVFVIARTGKKLEELVNRGIDEGFAGNIQSSVQDINNLDYFNKWFDGITKKGLVFDVLVNSAGIYPHKTLFEVEEFDWDNTFSTNLRSIFFITQHIARHMKRHKGGVIINIASFASKIPSVNTGIYAATKSALVSLIKSMASEWAPHNIRVNGINPGVIRTTLTEPLINQKGDLLKTPIAMQRFGSPEEVADVVLFLASQSSAYITGEVINVTGGKFITQNPYQAWDNSIQ